MVVWKKILCKTKERDQIKLLLGLKEKLLQPFSYPVQAGSKLLSLRLHALGNSLKRQCEGRRKADQRHFNECARWVSV